MPKLSPDEELERALRRLDTEAVEWKEKQRRKLVARRDFQEQPVYKRLAIRASQTLGILLGLLLILALVFGGGS